MLDTLVKPWLARLGGMLVNHGMFVGRLYTLVNQGMLDTLVNHELDQRCTPGMLDKQGCGTRCKTGDVGHAGKPGDLDTWDVLHAGKTRTRGKTRDVGSAVNQGMLDTLVNQGMLSRW